MNLNEMSYSDLLSLQKQIENIISKKRRTFQVVLELTIDGMTEKNIGPHQNYSEFKDALLNFYNIWHPCDLEIVSQTEITTQLEEKL